LGAFDGIGGVAGRSSLKGSCRTVSVAAAEMKSWGLGVEAVPRRFFGAQKSRASPANRELCSWSRLKDHRHQMG